VEKRKMYQAEYHLLTHEIEFTENQVIVHHNQLQEKLFDSLRADILTFLRETLNNQSVQLIGKLQEIDQKKMVYTNREKFEYLAQKNPALRELKDRLGLDTDF
jgi:DNA polymerase-3 subunit gamma/tau